MEFFTRIPIAVQKLEIMNSQKSLKWKWGCTYEALAGLTLEEPLLAGSEDDVVQLLVVALGGLVAGLAAVVVHVRVVAVALGLLAHHAPHLALTPLALAVHLPAVGHFHTTKHTTCTHRMQN